MALTTYHKFNMPDWKTARYDEIINQDLAHIEDAIDGYPSAYPPGSAENYPEVTLRNGMHWFDSGNNELKVYYNGNWVTIYSF